MSKRIVFFDDRGGCSPSWVNARACGGSEMHQIQIFEHLARKGHDVRVFHRGGDSVEAGVNYVDCERCVPSEADALVVIGCASMPQCRAPKTYAFQVVDPRPHPQLFDHLKGKATMVCVSEWQAGLFRAIGHEAVVIPVPIPDEWYAPPARQFVPGRFLCLSSWNKGARETIEAWDNSWGELAVGSPYSQPVDAEAICRSRGVTWLGALTPRKRWIEALMTAQYGARVCTIGETFGVTDAAFRAMGISSYTLCTGDLGALPETGAAPFHGLTGREQWEDAICRRAAHPGASTRDVNDFRMSKILPQWEALLA